MTNPFDPKSILLAKHAQHVVLIHFPVALFITGAVFDALSRGRWAPQLAGAAYWNLSAAALSVVPVMLTGVLAWRLALDGERLHGVLLLHVAAASIAALLILVSWWMHWRTRRAGPAPAPAWRLAIEFLGVAMIAMAAHLGGFLSGVNS